MRLRVQRTARFLTVLLCLPLLGPVPSGAQEAAAPPPSAPLPAPGFVPPYEITRIVRSAGFDPLAPPLREGATYVLRATDFRGILMRVVVDAHSGAIRAVNRIVAAPGTYGPIGMAPPPYDAPTVYDVPLPYDIPPPYDVPPRYGAPLPYGHAAGHAAPSERRPLPRPRPDIASRKPGESKAGATPGEPVKPNAKSDAAMSAGPASPRPPATPSEAPAPAAPLNE